MVNNCLMAIRFPFGVLKCLELGRRDSCATLNCVLHITELFPLHYLILCCVNIISKKNLSVKFKYKERKSPCVNIRWDRI